jgi:hypothetical protein
MRERYLALEKDNSEITSMLEEGATKARTIAGTKMQEVKKAIGVQ